MAYYQPPTPLNQDKFNPAGYEDPASGLTIAEADARFLRFPTAQGTENLSDVNVSGTLTITNNETNFGLGYQALDTFTGSAVDNTAFGYQALSILTDGTSNTAVGSLAMLNFTGSAATCRRNTCIGHEAGIYMTSGLDNTFVGFDAGAGVDISPWSNSYNTGIGSYSLKSIASGATRNTAVGYQSLLNTTGGDDNVAVGHNAGSSISTGINNTTIGSGAGGASLNTTSSNVFVGYNARVGGAGTGNAVGIGADCLATSNSVVIGNGASTGSTGSQSITIGRNSSALGANSVSIGNGATCAGGSSVSIGNGVATSASNTITLGTTSETVALNTITPLYSTIPTNLNASERLSFPTGAQVGSRCFATQANAGFALVAGQTSAFITFSTIPQGVYVFSLYADFAPYTSPAFGGYVEAIEGTRSPIIATTTGATLLNVSNNNGVWVNTSTGASFTWRINNISHNYTKAGGTEMRASLLRIA